jgi:hypothetical protein
MLEVGGAFLIMIDFRIGRVRGAIDFNNHLQLAAEEIDEVRADGRLANEFDAVETPTAQMIPDLFFGRGRA